MYFYANPDDSADTRNLRETHGKPTRNYTERSRIISPGDYMHATPTTYTLFSMVPVLLVCALLLIGMRVNKSHKGIRAPGSCADAYFILPKSDARP